MQSLDILMIEWECKDGAQVAHLVLIPFIQVCGGSLQDDTDRPRINTGVLHKIPRGRNLDIFSSDFPSVTRSGDVKLLHTPQLVALVDWASGSVRLPQFSCGREYRKEPVDTSWR